MIQSVKGFGFVRDKRQSDEAGVAVQSHSPAAGAPLLVFCLVVALVPLAFAAPLFEPYIATKEILVQAGVATVAFMYLLTTRAKLWTLTLTSTWIPLLALVLIGAVSILWSSKPSASVEEARRLVTYFLLFAIALHATRRVESRSTLTTALILAGVIEAVYVLVQYNFGDPLFLTGQLPGKWQTFGTLGNPNWTGEFLAVVALVSVGRLADLSKGSAIHAGQSWTRRLTLTSLILMLLALTATLARGAWLAFIIGAVAFLLVRHHYAQVRLRFKSSILPLSITGAGVVVILLSLLFRPAAINYLFNFKSLRGRIWMWAVTGTMIWDAPWGGHGLGSFGLQFPLYQARAFSRGWSTPFIPNASFTSYAHNDYLQIWAELGLFGLLALVALIWIVLKRGQALANDPMALGCWSAVICLLVNSAMSFPLHLPTSLMLFVVLVGAVESAVAKKTVRVSQSALARVAIALVILVFCFVTYSNSYHRLMTEAALLQADEALAKRRWEEADANIRTAIQNAPARQDGYAMLGRLRLERGEYREALTAFNQAMKLGFDVDVYDWKATALERSGQQVEAVAVLNELVRLRPDLQWPQQRLASLKEMSEIDEEHNR